MKAFVRWMMDGKPLAPVAGSHDLRLPAWGPYTKRYIGISHIPDVGAGLRFDLSVFPSLYRRRIDLPNVMWESGYYPWEAAPDLSYWRYRHQLIWKDQLYCDTDYCVLDDESTLIACRLVNRSDEPQNLALHYLAALHFPPLKPYSQEPIHPGRVELPPGGVWVDGLGYRDLHTARFDPRANLTQDGQIRGEIRAHGFVDGQGLGQGFGDATGDAVTYPFRLPGAIAGAVLFLRYRMDAGDEVRLLLSGLAPREVVLRGSGELELCRLPVGDIPAGERTLTLTSLGGAEVQIDGLALVPAARANELRFVPVTWHPAPRREEGPRPDTLLLHYADVQTVYGLAWGAGPAVVREFIGDDLDALMRHKVHEHVSLVLQGKGEGHHTNVFVRPLFLPPGGERTVYGLVCSGSEEAVRARLARFDPQDPRWPEVHAQARRRAADLTGSAPGETYRFSQERMATTVLTNVVYPVRTRGTWIRYHTPGRWWDCLYTWDSGFIGLGLLELDLQRAVDCLNAYVTEPGERDAAFIHHGSPVPVQLYLFQELWNRTQSRVLLEHFYPRLQQYHRFLAGRLGSSTTRNLRSGLLRTWDYFYNSGGWDDYPPQVYVHSLGLEGSVAPASNTAHAIRTARILRQAALALGEPVAEYDEDIASFTAALQSHAWDEESGYFGYVRHDTEGRPVGILRHEATGANFDMGLDGAYPLVAGACTPAQRERLVGYLLDPARLWCRCGISTVDQTAPYYRDDGYWNGAVWMPHQWFFWRALLDLGLTEAAHQVAHTALEVWKREVESSYRCFEHFIVQTGRGAGWHEFGGLSSPVLSWYGAYFRPGRLTTGLDAWVEALDWGPGNTSLRARLALGGAPGHTPAVIATLAPGNRYVATWDGVPLPCHERYPGTLEIVLPAGAGTGVLDINHHSMQ